MNDAAEKRLALIEAARLLFRTGSPTAAQVERVQKLMSSGLLLDCHCVGAPLQWTTTAPAIADYLAAESLERQRAKHPHAGPGQDLAAIPSLFGVEPKPQNDSSNLEHLYQDIWRDYFLSVFLRRKAIHQSVTFHRAVLAGQVAVLFLLVASMVGAIRLTIEPVPTQYAPVEQWIAANTDSYVILKWFPPQPSPDGEGDIVRVQYNYARGSSRRIETDRHFLVVGKEVTELHEMD